MGSNHDARDIANQQAQADQERREDVSRATGQVNAVYDAPGRQKQYSDFLNAMRQQYGDQLKRQQQVAQRNLKFSTARSGLSGGSQDVDSKRTLGEEFTKGVLDAENRSQAALGELKAGDEASRLNLIQLAQQGLGATDAASRAGAAISANAASARDNATAKGLGDVFGATADTYKRQQEAAVRRAQLYTPVGSPYGASAGFGGR